MSASELLDQVLKLPQAERQAIAEELWRSLESADGEPAGVPTRCDAEHLEEMKRRIAAVQSGEYESVSFQEAITYARQKLSERRA